MKRMLIIQMVIDVMCCGWILIEDPLIKFPTERALNAIESRFPRDDLSADAKRDLNAYTDLIVGNQEATERSLTYVRIGGLAIGALLFVQNSILLVKLGRISRPNKAWPDNPLPRSESEIESW